MKKIIFILSVSLVLIIGGCSNKPIAQLSREEVKSIAFSDAKVKEDNVSVKKTELETDGFKKIYEIEFISNNLEYEYTIDCENGKILKYSYENAD